MAVKNTENVLCQYNKIENTGHNCFTIGRIAKNIVIRYNECVNWKLRSSDGGALYSTGYTKGNSVLFERNVCHDAVGSTHGTSKATPKWNAAYADNGSKFVTYKENTIYNIKNGNALFFQQGTTDCKAIGNKLIVQNSNAFLMPGFDGKKGGVPETNNELTDNIFFSYSKKSSGLIALLGNGKNLSDFKLDHNAYCHPFCATDTIISAIGADFDLSKWKAKTGQDKNSVLTPEKLKSPVEVFFEVNISKTNKTITVPKGSWIDPFNKAVSGDISLEPYTSVILLKKN